MHQCVEQQQLRWPLYANFVPFKPFPPTCAASLTAPSRNSAPSSLSPSPAAAARAHSAAVGSGHSSAKGATMSAGGSGFRAASSWSPAGGPEAPRPFPSTGTLQMVRCIVREEGVAGLYRGFGISVASTVPTSAVWWGSYGEGGDLDSLGARCGEMSTTCQGCSVQNSQTQAIFDMGEATLFSHTALWLAALDQNSSCLSLPSPFLR